eukprot:5973493-Prymnesium_polylepis.1
MVVFESGCTTSSALSDAWLMCFGAVEKSAKMRPWISMSARNSAREKTKRTSGCAVPCAAPFSAISMQRDGVK